MSGMDIEYELRGIRFRWNEAKAKLNIKNHDGVSFEQAVQVFFDPLVQYQDASRNSEVRDGALGCDFNLHVLFVVHLEIENDFIRIISARKAESHERENYETGNN
jgi:uncharacterized DUF497 family protein